MDQSEPLFFDATPYLRLFIDKEGKWYQNGAEIIHAGVLSQFFEALEKDKSGGYRIRIGREVCSVEVEDAPFIVLGVVKQEDGDLRLELNDGEHETFDPDRFWINNQNIPYSMVKNGEFPARFSRPAYYELAKCVVFDEEKQTFFINLNGELKPIKIDAASYID